MSATKSSKSASKSASKKTVEQPGGPQSSAAPTPRPGDDANLLAGKAGPGPKVGDSAFQSASEDHLSKGRPTSDSDGTNAGSEGAKAEGKKKSAKGKAGKVRMGDIVAFVTTGRVPGKLRPAIVIRGTDPELENAENAPIDITVFPDSGKFPNNDHLGNTHYREGVLYSEGLEDGTWHLLEDSDDLLAGKEKRDAEAREQVKAQAR